MINILFVDDDVLLQRIFKMVLSEKYIFSSALTGNEGIRKIREESPDVVLLDINLPDIDGIEVLKKINIMPMAPPVIMVSALTETSLIVKAVQEGAYDYIIKTENPDFDKITGTIWRAIKNTNYKNISQLDNKTDKIVGETPKIKEVKYWMSCYSRSDSAVLIQGESGTGKELVAQGIHKISHRRDKPFIPVNCGAIPETLIESTLFGAEKGAYTDAVSSSGYFERANGGTIFLDEIGEMSKNAQVKLLRVLETKEIERVGGSRKIKVDVRIIAATNRNLKDEIKKENFRDDLYYRIGVLPIKVPPLRERKGDIPLLAVHLINHLSAFSKTLSPGALEKLCNYNWPGNIRELKNILERSILLSEKETVLAENIIFD